MHTLLAIIGFAIGLIGIPLLIAAIDRSLVPRLRVFVENMQDPETDLIIRILLYPLYWIVVVLLGLWAYAAIRGFVKVVKFVIR